MKKHLTATAAAATALLAHAQTPAPVSSTALAPVTVSVERAASNPLLQPSTAGSRLNLTALETPASTAIVSGQLVRQLGTQTLIDAKTLAPGLTSANSPGNGGNLLNARGFSGQNSVKQLYGGLDISNAGGVVSFPFDPWNIERIEALYGPASVLYGTGAIGGAVNVVPKRPNPKVSQQEVGLGFGSFGAKHQAFSSTGPINERFSYRFDISHRSADNWVDRTPSDTLAASASLRWDATDQLKFTLASEYGKQSPMHYLGTPVFNGAPVPGTLAKNYNIADSDLYFRDQWLTLESEWTPRSGMSFHNTLYRMDHRRRYRDATIFTFVPGNGTVRRTSYRDISHSLQNQIGSNTYGKVSGSIGGMANEFLAGFQIERSFYDRFDNVRGGSSVVNALNPNPGLYRDAYRGESRPEYYLKLNKAGVYFENRLSINPQLSVVAGLRADRYRTERQDRLPNGKTTGSSLSGVSGNLGVVVQPLPNVSVYGQWATASDPVASLASIGANQQGFSLSKGQQLEVGIKQSLFDGGLDWTLAAYQLKKKDLLTANLANPTVQEQVGQQSSRGIEASVAIKQGHWRVQANGTVLKPRFDDFKAQVGSRTQQLAGNVPATVHQRAANLLVFWDFAPDWTARSAVQYIGKRFTNNTNTSVLPSYSVLNLGLNWTPLPKVSLDLRVDNALNKVYASQGSDVQWILGRPRSVWLSGTYAF